MHLQGAEVVQIVRVAVVKENAHESSQDKATGVTTIYMTKGTPVSRGINLNTHYCHAQLT
ncbi:hypothetical protein EZV62_026970 [Acer yangbiense]|uniref:Uncharacterized protein n=1 Tax=Acer yangbiense TaxID=1000413 RepID=A0A5C7GU89_9ROSI|nr:hypothetical protein EZV62_026970 [Acer yangbiense]